MKHSTVVCIGTGPSLTPDQIYIARKKGFTLFGCNRIWEIVPDLALLYGCNRQFWSHYWCDALANHPCEKWTTNEEAAKEFGLNWIAEKNARGLSTDPSIVHHGHGSGYTLLNLAYLQGAQRIILLGYDLKYAPDYDGRAQHIGSSPRHYFGEYPSELQHWPSVKVKAGKHIELLELYESVAKQNVVEIINCTPGSAIESFPMRGIDAV
jgi:hypothetical protein